MGENMLLIPLVFIAIAIIIKKKDSLLKVFQTGRRTKYLKKLRVQANHWKLKQQKEYSGKEIKIKGALQKFDFTLSYIPFSLESPEHYLYELKFPVALKTPISLSEQNSKVINDPLWKDKDSEYKEETEPQSLDIQVGDKLFDNRISIGG